MDVRSKARLAALLPVALVATAAAGLAVGAACLPDLTALPPEDASFDVATPSFRGCGDGIIEALEDGGDAGESCDPGDADVEGCRSCMIACDDGKLGANGHCYFVAGTDDRYGLAVDRCASRRAHVVTVSSREESELVNGLASSPYWLGLLYNAASFAYGSANVEEPGLPLGPTTGPCDGCFVVGADGGALPQADAAAPSSDLNCVVATPAGWGRAQCAGTSYTTICEREPPGRRASFDCIGGNCFNVVATSGEKVYFVVSSSADPASAESNCALFDGGSLVVLRSADEREQLTHEILERSPFEGVTQTYWIGLSRDAGGWAWADGVAADGDGGRPAPWGNAQPEATGGARAYMRLGQAYDTQLAYANDEAGAPRRYICQRPPF